MLYKVLEANDGLPDDVIVCFANTGKEEEATLEFIENCSQNWRVPIHWLEYLTDEPKFKRVDFKSAARNGEPFEALITKKNYLPNPVTRFCTVELKILTIHKYLKSLGWDHNENMDWVGIRADEPRRAAKMARERTPLFTAGITAKDVGEFWKQQSFDLQLPNHNGKTIHGNCDLCFLKGFPQTLSLIQEKPSRAIWWANQEARIHSSGKFTGDGARFRKDRPSYSSMLDYSEVQLNMFQDFDDEGIACFCGD
jgi:3'-phosphoadenosine 5'-phosphosulfate sulfotransferase (PAPS reductase)/FAD synthetase